jgi:hypothetical protein
MSAGKPSTVTNPCELDQTARQRLAPATASSRSALGPSYGLSMPIRRPVGSSRVPDWAASNA